MSLHGDAKREYQRIWIAKRRQDWIDSKGGVCATCGSDYRLEVDHIDRTMKSMNTSDIWSRSFEVRKKELEKCQVLCNYHHKEKTRTEWDELVSHGTAARYLSKAFSCRCILCTEAWKIQKREIRNKEK